MVILHKYYVKIDLIHIKLGHAAKGLKSILKIACDLMSYVCLKGNSYIIENQLL